ncbi:ppsB, partial [Symbiodinium necroappetens]
VMMLDIPTTQRFINDCVSFHFDIVQGMSRQYMTSPVAFAMGAAMAGLLPANIRNVQTYPEDGKYCRMINQHLVRRNYAIRFAELSDLPSLLRLEEFAWVQEMRATEEVLKTRLTTSPTTNLVCELDGKVVAVLYMQRIASFDVLDEQRFMEISKTHDPDGPVVQLIAIGTDPEVGKLGIGSDLRSFALHLARLDRGVDCVVG